jgi:hypothetical protein
MRPKWCHPKAVLGQRDVDHSKTPIPNRFPECLEPLRIRCARQTEVAAAGAAHFIGDSEPLRRGTDLTVLGRYDVHADRIA